MKAIPAAVVLALAALGAAPLAGCSSTPTSHSADQFTDDAALTAKVKTALAKDSQVPAHDVNVTTYRGVVQLSGFVNNEDIARRAGEVARRVDGVRNVYNDLRVVPQPQG